MAKYGKWNIETSGTSTYVVDGSFEIRRETPIEVGSLSTITLGFHHH